MEIRPLPLSAIDESPSNPRKYFDPEALSDLARSIADRGVEQPIKVRPRGTRFELIFGARRVRASKIAGLKEIPSVVQEMDDAQVLEAQITENAQREDVHPLEEADAYRALHERHGRTVEEIAAKVGKSTTHVYSRIKLCSLCPQAREAFAKGVIDAATAGVLARVSDQKSQEKAAAEVIRGIGGHPLRAAEARALVRDRYMLALARAPFSAAAPDLVPGAGPCTTCPKRSGNQAALFADLGKTDLCTDAGCYAAKVEANWEKLARSAQGRGAVVLSPAASKKLFPVGTDLAPSCGYVDLDAVDEYAGGGPLSDKRRTYRQTLGKAVAGAKLTLARDPEGRPRELVEATEIRRACAAAGIPAPPQALGRAPKETAPPPAPAAPRRDVKPEKSAADVERQARERAKAGKEYRVAVVSAIVAAADKDGGSLAFWRTMARGASEIAHRETAQAMQERRGEKVDLAKLDKHGLALFVLEVLVTQGALYVVGDALPPRLAAAAKDLGVDLKKVRGELIAAAAKRRTAK